MRIIVNVKVVYLQFLVLLQFLFYIYVCVCVCLSEMLVNILRLFDVISLTNCKF